MSRSRKPRFGTSSKTWKDTVYAARCQAQARSKRKRRQAQIARAREKAALRGETSTETADLLIVTTQLTRGAPLEEKPKP